MPDPTDTALAKIRAALRPLSSDQRYTALASHLHVLFDAMDDRGADVMLMFVVTHALESRAARAEGRPPNFHTLHQLQRHATVQRDESGVRVSVNLSAQFTHQQWQAGHEEGERRTGGFFPRPAES